jgi:uncharacterized protein with HEPN domain
MKRDYSVYLDDILDAMDKAETFVTGMSYEQFEDDLRTVFAVTRALEIVVVQPRIEDIAAPIPAQ